MIELAAGSTGARYRRIADAIRQAVADGRLKPGDRLPSKAALGQHLSTSAITVGRSYDLLQREGIVVQRQGSGTYIKPDALHQLRERGSQRFSTIAVVVAHARLSDCSRDRNHVISTILEGVSEGLGGRPNHFRFATGLNHESLGDLPDDSAVLLLRSKDTEPAFVEELQQRNIPILGIWGDAFDVTVPRIDYDHHQAAALACQHLVDCGYKRIGFIGTMGDKHPLGAKFFEFTNVLYKAGLDFQVRHVHNTDPQPGHAFAAALEMIEAGDLPEAFFVDTDYKAMEVIAALHRAGLCVPDDLAIASHGGIPESASFNPPLTTVRIPRREIGVEAGRALLEWAEHQTPLRDVTLPAELLIRRTSRVAADRAAASGDVAATSIDSRTR